MTKKKRFFLFIYDPLHASVYAIAYTVHISCSYKSRVFIFLALLFAHG
jgi:hypothetical protein